MSVKAFLDTNVLIYAFAQNDPRTGTAEALLAVGGVISVQVLNEFVAVATRKLAMPWKEVLESLAAIRTLCLPPIPVTIETHEAALKIVKRHRYHIYDALVVAAAAQAGCDTLYSEDLHHGQVIDGLVIRNPFGTDPELPE